MDRTTLGVLWQLKVLSVRLRVGKNPILEDFVGYDKESGLYYK